MPRKGEKLSEEAKAKLKARWAEKRAKAVQATTDVRVTETHAYSTSTALIRARDELAAAKDTLARQLQMNASAQRELKSRTDELNELYKDTEEKLRLASSELIKKKLDVKNRSNYRAQQEKEIAEMIEKGNDRLYEVDQEVKEILRKHDEVNLELADLSQQKALVEQQKIQLETALSAEETKLENLRVRYNETAAAYRMELVVTRDEVKAQQAAIEELESKAKRITDGLLTKGKEISSRESAAAAKEAELVGRERLLKSRESRYS